jgi:hypothetical protein
MIVAAMTVILLAVIAAAEAVDATTRWLWSCRQSNVRSQPEMGRTYFVSWKKSDLDPAWIQAVEDQVAHLVVGSSGSGKTFSFARVLAEAQSAERKVEGSARRRRMGQWFADVYAWKITDLAAILAGRRRPALREEWRAHLIGEPGHELPAWQKARAACGFIAAVVLYRFQDAADLAWIPTDAILTSRLLSNLVVGCPTTVVAVILFHHGGIDEMIADAGSIITIGGALYGLIRIGRWWRGVKPPEPKARSINE